MISVDQDSFPSRPCSGRCNLQVGNWILRSSWSTKACRGVGGKAWVAFEAEIIAPRGVGLRGLLGAVGCSPRYSSVVFASSFLMTAGLAPRRAETPRLARFLDQCPTFFQCNLPWFAWILRIRVTSARAFSSSSDILQSFLESKS